LPDVSNKFAKGEVRFTVIGYFAWGCFRYFEMRVIAAAILAHGRWPERKNAARNWAAF
jgi:hypothetical protein